MNLVPKTLRWRVSLHTLLFCTLYFINIKLIWNTTGFTHHWWNLIILLKLRFKYRSPLRIKDNRHLHTILIIGNLCPFIDLVNWIDENQLLQYLINSNLRWPNLMQIKTINITHLALKLISSLTWWLILRVQLVVFKLDLVEERLI
jgi:hypothetical protein